MRRSSPPKADAANDEESRRDIPGGPAMKRQRTFDEWMALFLLDWVLIGMVIFYCIALGGLIGSLFAVLMERLLTGLGFTAAYFRLYPALGPAAKGMIAVAIVGLTLHAFHHIRYDCTRDQYYFARPGQFFWNLVLRVGAAFFILGGMVLMVRAAYSGSV